MVGGGAADRLRVRLHGAHPPLDEVAAVASRAGGRDVRVDGAALSMLLASHDSDTPRVIRALVEAGAQIREVFDEEPDLEEVYLKLLGTPERTPDSGTVEGAPDSGEGPRSA